MFLCKFERNKSVRNGLVLELLGLRGEEGEVACVQWVDDILSCWHELASLSINHHNHVKELHVHREVLDIV